MTVDKVKPKKALGQHFLTDLSVAGRIAATLSDYVGVPVIEVGPGMGVLTRFLLDGGHDLTVVELDRESVEYLQANFPQLHGRIVEADFLRLDLAELTRGREFCVIGNYPYNISSQIFFHILDYKDMVPCCSGMLQREVAERLAAPEGTKARGILSVLLQLWYRVDYLFTVSENVFNPPPKVKSGVIKLVRNDRRLLPCSEQLLKSVVKVTFGQRRKTIRNSIRAVCPDFPAGHPLAQMRPEQLSVEQFIELTLEVERVRAQA
ncbi:ribosomal RNA small subunit methyltransferase A [Muribaculaceae bacterium]|jgi:16S rRNA (adenine1518-N6/adenine1519-N6)-dimethyltransferase|nr:16S rRNA (adenine(1518)-N(6)/adenine(1519)-N(6))-dimethyltransferase RsmA [Muribaculaceae bacterium]GFI06003.1 ribosomal RNA small subunit methyltransferase A [Muribaculaceae bacterium]